MVMLHIKLKRITNAATWFPPPPHPRDGVNRQGYRQRYSTANMKHMKRDFRLRDGVKRSKFNFFRTCDVAYQGESHCSNIIANIFLADTPTHHPPGDGVNRSKFIFFRTWSCCISNSRQSRMQQHGYGSIYFAYRPPPQPWVLRNVTKFHKILSQSIRLRERTLLQMVNK